MADRKATTSNPDRKTAPRLRSWLSRLPDVVFLLLPRRVVDVLGRLAPERSVEQRTSPRARPTQPPTISRERPQPGSVVAEPAPAAEPAAPESAATTADTDVVADSGSAFDLETMLAEAAAIVDDPATVAAISLPSAPNTMDVDELGDLGEAIDDATHHWDDQHHATEPEPPPVASAPRGAWLATLNPLPFIERMVLFLLKGPLALLGRLVAIGECAVAKVADRFGADALSLLFSLVVAVIVANLTIVGIEALAQEEALRYPGWQATRNVRTFPLVGECGPTEFWFLTIDTAAVLAVVTFIYARKVEFGSDR